MEGRCQQGEATQRETSQRPHQRNALLIVGTYTAHPRPRQPTSSTYPLPTRAYPGADTQVGWIGRIPLSVFVFHCCLLLFHSMRNISTRRGVKDTPKSQDRVHHDRNTVTTATLGHRKADRNKRSRQAGPRLAERLTVFPRRRAPHKPTRLPRTSKQHRR